MGEVPDDRGAFQGSLGLSRVVAAMLLPTTLVGSYPQPDWLIDRASLAKQMPPRVRARDLWRGGPPPPEKGGGGGDLLAGPRPEGGGPPPLTPRGERGGGRF